MHHAVDAAVHGSAVVVLAAEIGAAGSLLVARHVNGMLHQLVYTLVLCGGNAHHRDAQDALHLVHANRTAVPSHLVHHIECQYHRHIKFHELQGQVKVPFDVGGVDDINEPLGAGIENELA